MSLLDVITMLLCNAIAKRNAWFENIGYVLLPKSASSRGIYMGACDERGNRGGEWYSRSVAMVVEAITHNEVVCLAAALSCCVASALLYICNVWTVWLVRSILYICNV